VSASQSIVGADANGTVTRRVYADAIDHSKEQFRVAHARAIKAGFSEREAPFAAQAFLMANTVRRPTVGQIRRHLRAEYGWLYSEEAS
jgi:hypothetical protein